MFLCCRELEVKTVRKLLAFRTVIGQGIQQDGGSEVGSTHRDNPSEASMSMTVSVPVGIAPRRVLYMGLSVVMALIAIVGFWPRYFGPLVLGTLVQPLLIHIHATVFTGWLVLFFLQAYFAATKRIQLHMTLGRLGIWYGLLLIVVGLTTGMVRAAAAPPAQAPRLLYVSVADMAMFGGFFAAAIWFRKKPKVHRPAMVVAATALLVAAVGRMTFLPPNGAIRLAIWSLPILIAMAFEFRKTGRVHPIYFLGLGVFVIRRYSVPVIIATDAWGSFARWVFGLVV